MAPLGPVEILTHERQRHWKAIAGFPKPLIAAVNGFALGGGCELALCADILVAGSNAQFGQPEINLGLIPGAGGTGRLARTVGKALTMQMVLTGQPIDARTALAAGIAVEVDEPESALARAVEIAALIATRPPLAVRLAKEAVLRAFESPLSEALAAEKQAFARAGGEPRPQRRHRRVPGQATAEVHRPLTASLASTEAAAARAGRSAWRPPMTVIPITRRRLLGAIALGAIALGVAGCASTTIRDSWSDPSFAGGPFRRIFVLGVFRDEGGERRTFEDIMSERLRATGVDAVPA